MSYLNTLSLQKHSCEFDIPFDRQQLADYLNLERSALSKELGKMQRDGLIYCKKVPSGTVLIDNLPSYCCADIANRKGMAFQDMDHVERNGALGKPKNRDWACCRADGCRISRENVQKV